MKKSILLVGGGHVCEAYKEATEHSDRVELVALCDTDKDCIGKQIFSNLPFFTDFEKAINEIQPDYVLIATPPETHIELALRALDMSTNVLVEKPFVININDALLAALTLGSNKHNIRCLFHYQHANEVMFFQEHFDMFKKRFGEIKEINMEFHESYAYPDGNVAEDRRSLMGAWYDSGINMLSIVEALFSIDTYTKLRSEHTEDKTGQLVYVEKSFKFTSDKVSDPFTVNFKIDWNKPDHDKITRLVFERGEVLMSHSTQGIYFKNEVVYEKNTESRLKEHYNNLFASFNDDSDYLEQEVWKALKLHAVLLS